MTTPPHQEEHRALLPGTASMRLAIALFAACALALITSCAGTSGTTAQQENLPDGARLLADSAAAMRDVNTIRFTVVAQGDIPSVPLRYAEGQLTEQGSAKGLTRFKEGEKVVEREFVITGDTLYLRDPSGQYQKLPTSATGATYNPTVILNSDRGVAAVLASGKDATTQARELIAGVDTYKVEATFPREPLSTLVPGITEDTIGNMWISTKDSRVTQAQFRLGDGLISVQLGEFDAPVSITAPTS